MTSSKAEEGEEPGEDWRVSLTEVTQSSCLGVTTDMGDGVPWGTGLMVIIYISKMRERE